MSGLSNLWSKLARSKKYREAFVAAQLKRGIPTQMRVLLKQREWSQAELADHSGLTQGAISRAADPDYGNLTFNNVLKIAAGFDIAFIGKFVPFSELASWYDSITDEEKLMVDSFDKDAAPQSREPSVEAAVSAHAAMPGPVHVHCEVPPDYYSNLILQNPMNNLAGALNYPGPEVFQDWYRGMAGGLELSHVVPSKLLYDRCPSAFALVPSQTTLFEKPTLWDWTTDIMRPTLVGSDQYLEEPSLPSAKVAFINESKLNRKPRRGRRAERSKRAA